MNKADKAIIAEALRHASVSIHHPFCHIRKSNTCTCHVAKAECALVLIHK